MGGDAVLGFGGDDFAGGLLLREAEALQGDWAREVADLLAVHAGGGEAALADFGVERAVQPAGQLVESGRLRLVEQLGVVGGIGREDVLADDDEGEEFLAADALGELQLGGFEVVVGELELFEHELGLLRQVHLEALALHLNSDGVGLGAEGVIASLGFGGEGFVELAGAVQDGETARGEVGLLLRVNLHADGDGHDDRQEQHADEERLAADGVEILGGGDAPDFVHAPPPLSFGPVSSCASGLAMRMKMSWSEGFVTSKWRTVVRDARSRRRACGSG